MTKNDSPTPQTIPAKPAQPSRPATPVDDAHGRRSGSEPTPTALPTTPPTIPNQDPKR